MNEQEILTKVIEKAEKAGWTREQQSKFVFNPSFIFDHDFAKAFFGEEYVSES